MSTLGLMDTLQCPTPGSVARSAGHSMEPHVSDSDLCILREAPWRVVASRERYCWTDERLLEDAGHMRRRLRRLSQAGFLADVGDMQHFPANSQVLQRRQGYRDMLGHYCALIAASRLSVLGADMTRLLIPDAEFNWQVGGTMDLRGADLTNADLTNLVGQQWSKSKQWWGSITLDDTTVFKNTKMPKTGELYTRP